MSENANGAESSNPGGVLEIRRDQPTRHWLCDRRSRADLSSRPSVSSSWRARTPMRRRGGNNWVLPPLSVAKMTLRLYGALNYSHGLSKGPSFGTGRGLEFVCIFGHDGHAAAPLGFFQTDRGFVVGDSPTGCESIIEQRTHRVACLPPAALSTRNQILSLARI